MTPPRIRIEAVTDGLGVALSSPEAGPKPTTSLHARRSSLASPEEQLRVLSTLALERPDGPRLGFEGALAAAGSDGLYPAELEVFQINLGKLCNMTCRHCHVDAGPDRMEEMMAPETIDACLAALDRTSAHTVDITGGAPELHPGFRALVEACVARGKHVIDRCNLTILLVPKFRDMPEWLAERGVEIVASLPHHRKRNTDAQRGEGTHEKSIEALRRHNAAGYGAGDPRRVLTLMSNPSGAFLGGNQAILEREWKAALSRDHGVTFDRLFVLNNMPISRFLEWLVETRNLDGYMRKLAGAFNPTTLPGLMCRNTISVSWDGRIYDCDFNQMLEIEAALPEGPRIEDFDPVAFGRRRIRTADHCFGCTAGCGSSCGGATV
jgi:radical SAM/Cys-rich protein